MSSKQVVALVGGEYHPFAECGRILTRFVENEGIFRLTVTENRDILQDKEISRFDAVMIYTQGGTPTDVQLNGLLGYVRGGRPLIAIHSAAATWKQCDPYIDMVGCALAGHGPVAEFPVRIINRESPITGDLADFRIVDELYELCAFDETAVDVLATAAADESTQVVAYTKSYGAGWVFFTSLGHDEKAFEHPQFQKLIKRALSEGVRVTGTAGG